MAPLLHYKTSTRGLLLGGGGARADWERRPLEESAVALGQLRAASILERCSMFMHPPAEGGRGCHRINNADHVLTRADWERGPLDEAAVTLGPLPHQSVESKDTHRP